MPQSGAGAETWLVETQTLGWMAAGAQVVPSGLVLDMEGVLAALGPSNPSNDNMIRALLFLRLRLELTLHFIFINI